MDTATKGRDQAGASLQPAFVMVYDDDGKRYDVDPRELIEVGGMAETAAERDRLKALNAELVATLENISACARHVDLKGFHSTRSDVEAAFRIAGERARAAIAKCGAAS